jgi:hypothetical protein
LIMWKFWGLGENHSHNRCCLRLCIVSSFSFGTHFALDSSASKVTRHFLDDWSRKTAGGAFTVLASMKLKQYMLMSEHC